MEGDMMLGPIMVALAGVSFPIVAGMWLAPRRDSDGAKQVLMQECRGCLQALATATQSKTERWPAGLGSSST